MGCRYGQEHRASSGAPIDHVDVDSPAFVAGLVKGGSVLSVNGREIRDLLDWKWETDGEASIEIIYESPHGDLRELELERDWGEGWGFVFRGVIYDGVRTCKNACTFCFMTMLPPSSRASLSLRDDDYRLSFLEGNFVTFTNIRDEDIDRIIEMNLSPLNMSLHAVTSHVRRALMGRNHDRGLEVLDMILDSGIEIRAQIVLVPGENDGVELEETLRFIEDRPGITSVGIVPLGFTKHQTKFSRSYSDDREAAVRVIEQVSHFRDRSYEQTKSHRFHIADELNIAAGLPMLSADEYDGFPQFDDGIGMIRSTLDEIEEVFESGLLDELRNWLSTNRLEAKLIVGTALSDAISNEAPSEALCAFNSTIELIYVENLYFGGNVNVTGLLTAQDILRTLPSELTGTLVLIPDIIVNHEGMLLCDTPIRFLIDNIKDRGASVEVVPLHLPEMISTVLDESR